METSQPLAIESFSYSWLSDHKPSLDGLDEPPRASIDSYYGGTSEEFNYEMLESNRFLTDQNFNFDAIAQTPATFIHADELFTDGFIRPTYIDPSKSESCNTLDSIQTTLSSSISSRTEIRRGRIHCSFFRRWRKSTQQILRNLFGHLRPFCHKVGCSRKSTRVDDIDRRMWKVKSSNSSSQASPQQSSACSMGASCHLENSIYEAVLHCKRSIDFPFCLLFFYPAFQLLTVKAKQDTTMKRARKRSLSLILNRAYENNGPFFVANFCFALVRETLFVKHGIDISRNVLSIRVGLHESVDLKFDWPSN
ncbi:hypothetical protein REPUB_Repub12eG0174700 [Reevesia pubescens]